MKLRHILTLLSAAALIGLPACGTTSEAEADQSARQGMQAESKDDHSRHAQHKGDRQEMMSEMCPMKVEGTTRQVVKLDDAVAMDFTTTGDVDDLRERAQKMAQAHQRMHAKDAMEGNRKMVHGEMTEDQREMRREMLQTMSSVSVETEEIDSGMRLRFTPEDADQVDEVHEMMERHTDMMGEKGNCPMM